MTYPLEGMVVLDLTSYLAGPYGCALLGEMGAQVIKVEAPSGDLMRQYPSSLEGENRAFLGANRNKRSIVINLKSEGGRRLLGRMVTESDILVHNYRPGVAETLGIGYEQLRVLRPDLLYCSLSGYGEDGPMRHHPGYDQMLQCFSGIAKAQGEELDGPQVLRGSIVDLFTSSILAYGVMGAVVQRLRRGEGQHVQVSLLRSALALQVGRFVAAEGEPVHIPREPLSSRVAGAFPTKEGHLYFQASTPDFWHQLCNILGVGSLAENPRYDTLKKRYNLSEEIMPPLKAALLQRTATEWETLMMGKVPAVAVRDIGELFDHPQIVAEQLAVDLEHPGVGRYKSMAHAVKLGSGSPPIRRAPLLGEDTDEILRLFGLGSSEVAALRDGGVIV